MLTKLLVPVDGSTLSEKALPYALKLAGRLELQVTLLRVVEGPAYLDKPLLEASPEAQAARLYLDRVSDFLISKREKPLIPPHRWQTKLLFGDPAGEICRYALEEKFDLVAMTTHGQPMTREFYVGSVTRKILQHLTIPVLLVRPYGLKTPTHNELSEIMACLDDPFGKRFLANGVRFVLPLDMTDKAEASLYLGFELAQKLNAALYLLKINNPVLSEENLAHSATGGSSALAGRDLSQREEANLYLRQIESLAEKHGVETVKIVLSGNPAIEITAFAELMVPDALVMATHTLGEDSPSTLPSLTQEVMRRTHLPVFMVPIARPVNPTSRPNPALA